VRQRAEALAGSADLAAAIMLLEDGVDAGKSRLGEDDPEVLATAHQLARAHLQADDPAAARRVLEEAYAAGQWRLGDADPLMLEISFDLGVVAEELGNRHEARKAFTRVAETGAAILGADHWAVRRAQAYLGTDPSAVRAEQPTEPTTFIQPAPTPQPPVRHFPPQQAPQQAPIQRTPILQQPAHEPPARHFPPQQAPQQAPIQRIPALQQRAHEPPVRHFPAQQAQQPPLEAPTEQFPIHRPPGQQHPAQHVSIQQEPLGPSTMEMDLSRSDTAQFAAIPPVSNQTTPSQGSAGPHQTSFTQDVTGPSRTSLTQDVTGPNQTGFTQDTTGPSRTSLNQDVTGPSQTGFTQDVTGPDPTSLTQDVTGTNQTGFTDDTTGPIHTSFTRDATGPDRTGFTHDTTEPDQNGFAWDGGGSGQTTFVREGGISAGRDRDGALWQREGGIAAGPDTTGPAGDGAIWQPEAGYTGAPAYDAFTEPTVAQQAIVPVRHTVTPPPPPELLVALPINAGQTSKYGPRPDSYQRRGSIIFAAIAACLAAIIAVVALVFVLANRGGDGKDDTPVLAGEPPTGVSLDDQGTRIALSWTDPAAGKTTFLVTGGHPGELLKPMGQTGPGTTEYALDGLNVKLDYCFAIVAVYSTSQFATSPQVCTSRPAQPTKQSAADETERSRRNRATK
jgi:hypothetical protein